MRFVVAETTGFTSPTTGGLGRVPPTEVMVLDSAYCYRVVWAEVSHLRNRPVDRLREKAIEIADARNRS